MQSIESDNRGMCIRVIDDNPNDQQPIRAMLNKAEHRARTVSSLEKGLSPTDEALYQGRNHVITAKPDRKVRRINYA